MNYNVQEEQQKTIAPKEIYGHIYIITNDINDRVYIGKTTNTIKKRFERHYKDGKNCNNTFSIDYAMRKYGKNHFQVRELGKYPVSQLSEKEQYWIQYYNSYNKGYNLTLGGEGMQLYSEEQLSAAIALYQEGTLLTEITQKTGISFNTIYRYLHSNNIPLRECTERQKNTAVENLKKASQAKQVKVHNITLDIYYDSKKDALIDMINKGYSKAKSYDNIRSALDKALKDNTKTFLKFYWRVVNE